MCPFLNHGLIYIELQNLATGLISFDEVLAFNVNARLEVD